ncbi:MAG: lactate racemase domain-containing protein [Deltaproteobacteria bacterium]|nr:lactate racemase domain-containing protein [Deltaproteobacteria bacterium]
MNPNPHTEPKLPGMQRLHRRFQVATPVDIETELTREWSRIRDHLQLKPGSRVAVGVGSRGISNLKDVVAGVVARLKGAGYLPFILPAMGSHGGATAEGQVAVLRARGITEESVGAPVQATMDVNSMGEADGIPLFLNRLAHEADAIVPINRVKPHTNFIGPTESGLIKMMAIGFGNQVGAEHYHRLSVVRPQYEILSTAGKAVIARSPILFGVALLENHDHQTAQVKMALPHEIEAVETELLKKARAWLPLLPLDDIDLLIIDEMGKDISGEGIDPNVVGRDVCAYGVERPLPRITRIFVRDLSEGSEGSAIGIAQADFTTRRLVDKIDFQATAINCLTACAPEAAKIPLAYDTDREAIEVALKTIRPCKTEDIRLVHIKNTMELSHMMVSEGCLPTLKQIKGQHVGEEVLELLFDSMGNLISLFSDDR